MLGPCTCGAKSSSIRSERKLLDLAGCWSCMCRFGVLSSNGLVEVIIMVDLEVIGFKLMGVCSCGGSSLVLGVVNVVDKTGVVVVIVSVGMCEDTGVMVFCSVPIRDEINVVVGSKTVEDSELVGAVGKAGSSFISSSLPKSD